MTLLAFMHATLTFGVVILFVLVFRQLMSMHDNGHGEQTFPIGATVTFLDDSATVEDNSIVIASGTVYDDPIEIPDGTRVVPVWMKHRFGEGVVHVHESNIIGVDEGRFP